MGSNMKPYRVNARSENPAATQSYGVQVRPGPQLIVTGNVHPDAVVAAKASTRPRTTLYFKRDMTAPFFEKKCFARGLLYYAAPLRKTMGFTKIQPDSFN